MALTGKNISLPIYHKVNGVDVQFNGLALHKFTVDSVVMSLGDKITGDVYYHNSNLQCTMQEYVIFNDIEYTIVNPPTLVREGMVSDNSDLKGMSKYSFEFYHPMYILGNLPFTDVAVSFDEMRYKSQDKTFSWIGKPMDFVNKLNKNLEGTEWVVVLSDKFPLDQMDTLSEVLSFDNNTIADVLKTGYETWGAPFVVDKLHQGEYYHIDANNNNVDYYTQGKRFVVVFGLPSNEIYESETARHNNQPFVFRFGQGVGLKNNSRTPRNNKIVTRIAGYGSENNIPYGYPQIRWYGDPEATCTIGDSVGAKQDVTINGVQYEWAMSYPIYDGIVGGEWVKLIKHPFTRKHLMPTVYAEGVFNKVSQYLPDRSANPNFNPNIEIKDYYDAISGEQDYPYVNLINAIAPSYEIHGFDDIKPELGEAHIVDAFPINADLTNADSWDDTMDDNGNYLQSYFKITLPPLSFDIYACAAITQEMQINMRSGACIGCTFTVQVDWEDYKLNFYDNDGNFAPNGQQRNYDRYPSSYQNSITVIVQKDNNTFGTLMPNIYQHPKGINVSTGYEGDAFVVLGISLPLSYITDAQIRLDEAMKSYMLENNVYYFDYPLKFDEFFLANNTNILNQIRPNTIIRFMFNDNLLQLFVKQLTIKFNDNVLPQYDITLTDNVEVVLNQIGQVADDVEHLGTLISLLRQQYGRNVYAELTKKLSKVEDDTAQGLISFNKGWETSGFFSNNFLGYGAKVDEYGNGEFEQVSIRGALKASELIFNMISAEEGESIRSVGHGEIRTVIPFNATTGQATLELDGNEWASIAVGDICRGMYSTINKNYTNSQVDGFDDNGFRNKKGFFASYFVVTNILLNVMGECVFDYVLQNENGTPLCEHPCQFMKFAVYGNTNNQNKYRQSSIYTTAVGIAPRLLFLAGVNNFKIEPRFIKLAIGNIGGLRVVEEITQAEYDGNNEDHFTSNINGVQRYFRYKELAGDAGFYCEDNIYLGGIINQFKAAALDAITSDLGVLGQTWVFSNVTTFVVDCDSNGKASRTQSIELWGELMYGNEKLELDTTFSACLFEKQQGNSTINHSPSFSENNTRASKSYTFNQGDTVNSHLINIVLKSIVIDGVVYSARKSIAIIANKQGAIGERGNTGASIVFLGSWSEDLTPVWTDNVRNCVKHNGTYWLVNVAEDGSNDLGEPSQYNTNWEDIGAMRFVATEVLLAERATISNLIANYIQTADYGTPHVRMFGKTVEFYGTSQYPSITLETNDDGVGVLRFYNKNGIPMYDLGPDKILETFSEVDNSWTEQYMRQININGGTQYLGSLNSNQCTKYYRFNEGYKKIANQALQYNVSNSSLPSVYNGTWFTSMNYNGTAILDGWYAFANNGSHISEYQDTENVSEWSCESIHQVVSGKIVESIAVWFKMSDWYAQQFYNIYDMPNGTRYNSLDALINAQQQITP